MCACVLHASPVCACVCFKSLFRWSDGSWKYTAADFLCHLTCNCALSRYVGVWLRHCAFMPLALWRLLFFFCGFTFFFFLTMLFWCPCWVLFLIDATHSTGTFVMLLPYDGVKLIALVVISVGIKNNIREEKNGINHKGTWFDTVIW